ncbi:MAG: hypothetical protein JKY19_07535 [Alcanivoracaceae bacterium]|nr:hypothetical protein [Alcanivoracaceae bacterium]
MNFTPSRAYKTLEAPEPISSYPHARKVGQLLFLSAIGYRQEDTKEINEIPGKKAAE